MCCAKRGDAPGEAHKQFPRRAAGGSYRSAVLNGGRPFGDAFACLTLPPTYISWSEVCTQKSRLGVRDSELSRAEHVLYGKNR